MPSTLTARGEDGKRWEKFERNTRNAEFCAILLCLTQNCVAKFAQGFRDAQLRGLGCGGFNGESFLGIFGGFEAVFASKPAPIVDAGPPRKLWERACSRRGLSTR